jgi:deoxyribonuclease-4
VISLATVELNVNYLGAHVKTEGGVENAPARAREIGADTFALFTANQRTWRTRPLSDESTAAFKEACRLHGYPLDRIIPHTSYLINLGATDPDILEKSRNAFLNEMKRCERLGISMINFHPGAHKGRVSDTECLDQIVREVNRALEQTRGVTAVVEITAGQGSNVGHRLEHLAHLIQGVRDHGRVGFCLDTCHLFAAGYDIRTPGAYRETMMQVADIVGLNYLRAMHLNDSQHLLGSRKDRHARLGAGAIGWEAFRLFMEDPEIDGIPLILETPEPEHWAEDLEKLRHLSPGNR